MRKTTLFSILLCNIFVAFSSVNIIEAESNLQDTIRLYQLDELVVTRSVRETNELRNIPSSVSVLLPRQLRDNQITSLPDLSAFVPNFFIPSYGASISTPIYIRGIGARSGASAVSLYVDNVPSFNPAAFDVEFQDIQRIEVLRGAQGTLYGRNAIGGIVNIYTLSPLTFQGISAAISGGNYGHFLARASNYQRLSDNFGVSVGGFYRRNDGFFVNQYTGKKADASESMGGRIRMDWNVTPSLRATLFSNYSYLSQGAFPYMHADSAMVNFNEPSFYRRNLSTGGLSLRYLGQRYSINATTGYQFLSDNMAMDQDFSPASVFSIQQRQRQFSISQEVTVRSEYSSRYSWIVGAFGFLDNQNINTTVRILEDGTAFFSNMFPTFIQMMNDEIEMPGEYRKPVWGAALFYQFTLNDLFGARGLSATAGTRFDFERTGITFDTGTQGVGMIVRPPMPPPAPPIVIEIPADTTLTGTFRKGFFEVLPKFALHYRLSETLFFYTSASMGYKSGGFNEQSFSHILRDAMMEAMVDRMLPGMIPPGMPMPGGEQPALREMLAYQPERSWTFEVGGRKELFDRRLATTFALFYSHVNNIQIIQLLDGGASGRIITNAGRSTSRGAELGLRFAPTANFTLFSEYGFADARFSRYDSGDNDLAGNRIPFAPQHTLSVGASYVHRFAHHAFIDRLIANVSYTGVGRIYWTEENDVYQPFYGITNASIAVERGAFGLDLWARNLFSTQYNAFFVNVSDMGGNVNPIVQRGFPLRMGVTLRMML